jgi:hypothetical protein
VFRGWLVLNVEERKGAKKGHYKKFLKIFPDPASFFLTKMSVSPKQYIRVYAFQAVFYDVSGWGKDPERPKSIDVKGHCELRVHD